jgi:ectoine hydroxylase-related dioxygenase (phytanoyl-CoA dioxygenase family)
VKDGWTIVEGLLSRAEVDTIREELTPLLDGAPFGANSFVGRRTKRVFGLPAKTRALDALLTDDRVLALVRGVLGPEVLLSTAVAVEIHPGEVAQTLHTDGGAWPVPSGEVVVNAIWALHDFTKDNGATALPGDRVAEMAAGSALVYVGSLPHGGGANTSDTTRLGIVVGYTVAWIRQQENYSLLCPPSMARVFPPRLQALLGYRLYPPFVGHVDGRDPRELLE